MPTAARTAATTLPEPYAHLLAQLAVHLLRHTLGDGHGGHAARLRAAHHAVCRVAILVQVLRELHISRNARA